MAGPGFPVGGGGGADLRCGRFSVKTRAKTKELDLDMGKAAPPAPQGPPGSANAFGLSSIQIFGPNISLIRLFSAVFNYVKSQLFATILKIWMFNNITSILYDILLPHQIVSGVSKKALIIRGEDSILLCAVFHDLCCKLRQESYFYQ